MGADLIQANYDALDELSKRFIQQADATHEMHQRLQQTVERLQGGGWQGEGANAFFAEMNAVAFPTLIRLKQALTHSGKSVLYMKDIWQAAEEEASRPFWGNGQPDIRVNTGTPIPGEINDTPVSSGKDGQGFKPSRDLIVKDPKEVFNKDYMAKFIGSRFKGENSTELNGLLEELLRKTPASEAEAGPLLDRITDIRGVDRTVFRQQYQTFLNLWNNASGKGDIDLARHPDYMGSTVSLRYGAVVGDIMGIDPVFGVLLNPTGGLVGPGSTAYQPGPNDAIGYHGVFHDAAGYLYNMQGQIGPGYNYLDRADPFGTNNPLAGQLGGISWWASHPQLDVDIVPHIMPDIPYVPDFVERAIANTLEDDLITHFRQGVYVIEGGTQIIDGIGDVFEGSLAEGGRDILTGGQKIIGGTARTIWERIF